MLCSSSSQIFGALHVACHPSPLLNCACANAPCCSPPSTKLRCAHLPELHCGRWPSPLMMSSPCCCPPAALCCCYTSSTPDMHGPQALAALICRTPRAPPCIWPAAPLCTAKANTKARGRHDGPRYTPLGTSTLAACRCKTPTAPSCSPPTGRSCSWPSQPPSSSSGPASTPSSSVRPPPHRDGCSTDFSEVLCQGGSETASCRQKWPMINRATQFPTAEKASGNLLSHNICHPAP